MAVSVRHCRSIWSRRRAVAASFAATVARYRSQSKAGPNGRAGSGGRGGGGAGASTVPLKGKPSATVRDRAGARRLRVRVGGAAPRRRAIRTFLGRHPREDRGQGRRGVGPCRAGGLPTPSPL